MKRKSFLDVVLAAIAEGEPMFARLFLDDGSYRDGELRYEDLGVEGDEHKYMLRFRPGLPKGILPTHAVRLIGVSVGADVPDLLGQGVMAPGVGGDEDDSEWGPHSE